MVWAANDADAAECFVFPRTYDKKLSRAIPRKVVTAKRGKSYRVGFH